jgi:hypothetical protein
MVGIIGIRSCSAICRKYEKSKGKNKPNEKLSTNRKLSCTAKKKIYEETSTIKYYK